MVEDRLLPLNDGPAYFALRSKVPLVLIAINGTSWLRFGARVLVRIGDPILAEARLDRAAVDAMTATSASDCRRCWTAPRPSARRSGRRLDDRAVQRMAEGSRDAALHAQIAGTAAMGTEAI